MTNKQKKDLINKLVKANQETFYKRYCNLPENVVVELMTFDRKSQSNRLTNKLWSVL